MHTLRLSPALGTYVPTNQHLSNSSVTRRPLTSSSASLGAVGTVERLWSRVKDVDSGLCLDNTAVPAGPDRDKLIKLGQHKASKSFGTYHIPSLPPDSSTDTDISW